MESQIKFSLIIITLNEERNIQRCLSSVPFANDIVVLDSGSTDRTLEIAQSLGARVASGPWRGYGKQKMRAAALGKYDWVLSLDADEALSEEAQAELQAFLQKGQADRVAYSFPRKTWHLGRWLRYGGCYPDRQIRFYNKTQCEWTLSQVHETLNTPNLGQFQKDILHWSFKDVSHQIQTINKYSSLKAIEWKKQGKKFSYLKLLTKPIWRFFQNYILKLGFLDGFAGFEVAVVSGFSYFMRLVKLKESSH